MTALLVAALLLPAARPANPWRNWFTARVRLATYAHVDRRCQAKARQLMITTHEPVACVAPDPSQYRVVNTGYRRAIVIGFFEVEWVAGPRDGLTYLYSSNFDWRGTLMRVRLRRHSPWEGPFVVSR